MNLAIIIGVSQYQRATPLPGCWADACNMRDLLVATGKYQRIITITHKTRAHQIKTRLKHIVEQHSQPGSEPINELLVYFSGHGVFTTQVLLCCSDFDPLRPEATSIPNDCLDDVFRTLKPKLSVKLLDACQSGEPYIKSAPRVFKRANSPSRMPHFICMASSRYDQPSMATQLGSVFTTRWIGAVLHRSSGDILYSEIQESVAESFRHDGLQRPYFVQQGHGLDVFARVNEQMIRLAKMWDMA